MVSVLKKYEEEYGITITFSVENEPLGTAGPLALAREVLGKDDSPFFVLNSDVTCEYPFNEMVEFHKAHGGEGTILATKVEEPSKYGVIVTKPNSTMIDRFVEKPVEFVGNRINAGIYIFNPAILDRIEVKPTSIEQEVFPAMARDNQLHKLDLEGFWMDIGQPKDFLTGTCLYLSYLAKKTPELLVSPSENYVHGGNVLIHPTAKIGFGCKIGPNVTIGPNVVVGDGVRLQRCVIMEGVHLKSHACVKNSIVGWHSSVGSWSRLDGVTVLGDDVHVADEVYVNGAFVLPHKSISSNIPEPKVVM
ncbi:Mannose-1-phosphate guanyltransferase [Zancudomyces culisetae]|uniref:mannose-1-phosphate guanylyltransferase n=1 Tax=Zancudomyces culisetae TaxID=1213189 RepID=A0A1R1PPP3_ZANCU|nr:Mannose-1-phosphate guanyltransferase [Zancudomyces culisetae]|eukprot:OMH82873.1 Mannose-1-phosphate guanyltransferase [Zancudomyces culisetae]